jgi:hypothetical protein
MDTGDEMRGLASSLGRKPGASRTIIRDAVIPRQDAQLDRVQGAMKRDLGPTANVRLQSEALIKDASEKAAPLYKEAYATPAFDTPVLRDLLRRPAMKQALARARTIAAEEGRDPDKMGLIFDKDGLLVKTRKPTMQTLDYIKRGMDDVIEAGRDPVTGRLKLDEAGRAINATQRQFIAELDKNNPAYAAARAAYGGPARASSALNKGARIGTKDAEQIGIETRDLSPVELEHYKLGVRSALSKALEGRTDAADKVKALVGTPKKRAALAQLFGGTDKFDNFMATLADEQSAAATHARVNTGSPTAANLADDAHLEGLAGVAANAGVRAIKGHGMISNVMATISDLARYGGGKSAERLRAQLAAGISETDPVAMRKSLDAATAELARRKQTYKAPVAGTIGALSQTRNR